MSLETGTYISDFNTSNPVDNTDHLSTLGSQDRWIKTAIKNTFPNVNGAVTATHTELSAVTSKAPQGLLTASGLTIGTAKLAGRTTSSTGALEEIAIGSGLSMSAGSLTAAVGDHFVTVNTGNGVGAVNTAVRRWTTTQGSAGTAITYADSANNGGSFTINEPGLYAMYAADICGGLVYFGISVNSAQLTTAIESITTANRIAIGRIAVASNLFTLACVSRFAATDVVRMHMGGIALTGNTAATSIFSIRKIGV